MTASSICSLLLPLFWAGISLGSAENIERSINNDSILGLQSTHFSYINPKDHAACHENILACLSCTETCTFQKGNGNLETIVNASIALEACTREFARLEADVPTWCQVDGNGFSSKKGQSPPSSLCGKTDMNKCVNVWKQETDDKLETGKISHSSTEYKLALRASEYVHLQTTMLILQRERVQFQRHRADFRVEQKKKLLEQAYVHLRRLDENRTMYSDPVYYGIQVLKSENSKLDLTISRNDPYNAGIENGFVRRETLDKVPELLRKISGLTNRINSRKAETDPVLAEIKAISSKTVKLQEQATNVLYETVRAPDVNGALSHLDAELFDLFLRLRKERDLLTQMNLKATSSKLRLVEAMRRLVREISRKQSERGCSSSDLVSFKEFGTSRFHK